MATSALVAGVSRGVWRAPVRPVMVVRERSRGETAVHGGARGGMRKCLKGSEEHKNIRSVLPCRRSNGRGEGVLEGIIRKGCAAVPGGAGGVVREFLK